MSEMLVKYPHPNSVRWALWTWADIPSEADSEKVYLRRLRLVQTPWCGMYLHWINEPDTGRDPHDHPWRFWSFIVRGWYTEDVFAALGSKPVRQRWCRWSLHHMPLNKAHKITEVSDSLLTLLFVGKRVRQWNFWTDKGKIPWRTYLRNRAAQAPPV